MAEYINRQAALEALDGKIRVTGIVNAQAVYDYSKRITERIRALPAADAVEVVRCKDCKHLTNDGFCSGRGWPMQLVPEDGYCDKGEKREDG